MTRTHFSKWRFAIASLSLAAAGPLSIAARAETPTPAATAAIAVTPTSHPFTVGGTDLAARGYRLDEYFISGKANVYDWGADDAAPGAADTHAKRALHHPHSRPPPGRSGDV